MILKTARIVYSRVTLIPWSSMDTDSEEIPERGLHWGTRESNYITSSTDKHSRKSERATPARKPKAAK